MTIGQRISKLRQEHDLQQKELAEAIKMNRIVLNRIELGKRPLRDDEAIAIANFFHVSTDYLLGLTDIPDKIDNISAKNSASSDTDIKLTESEREMIEKFRALPERNRLRIEARVEAEYDMEKENQKENTPPKAKRA